MKNVHQFPGLELLVVIPGLFSALATIFVVFPLFFYS